MFQTFQTTENSYVYNNKFNELIKSIGLGWAWTFVDFLNLATSARAKGDGTTSRPCFFFKWWNQNADDKFFLFYAVIALESP